MTASPPKHRRATPAQSRAAAEALLETYHPFPKQEEFHSCRAKYRLFGGAAGPGKTKALLWEAIIQALEHPGVDTLLLRRTFPELEQSLLGYFHRDVPRGFYRGYSESKHVVSWWNGSTTRFGYCKSENDVYQYQGAEFLFIGIDELTLFTLKQWQFLTSRNRCPVRGTFPNMAGATNPGNIGHAWVKALWIERQAPPGMERPEQYDPGDYAFIPARVWDNPIYADDESYLKTLRALPTHLRQAFLEGDWNVFAGQYFDVFDLTRHVERAEALGFEDWWPRWISIDWGFAHNAAVLWHAAAPAARRPGGFAGEPERAEGRATPSPRSLTITYRELVLSRLSPRALAQEIIERSVAPSGRPERIEAVYLSPDAFAQRTAEASIADQIGDVLVRAGLPRPQPADDDRIGGWMLLYQLLEAGEWIIAENCQELIRTLPVLTRDEAQIEDILKIEGDDAADSARYGLKSRLRPRRPPLEQRVAEKVTSADPTQRAIQAQKALLEEQRRVRPVPFFRFPRGRF